jgi:hypothetical protein
MIPGTLLGALFLAACLVPGFVFIRIGERRRARLARSSLVEAVELAGIGAATSLISVMAVLSLGRSWDVLDVAALAEDPGTYLLLHPVRGLGSILASFVLSSLLALAIALIVFAKRKSVFEPAGSTWGRVFFEDRPPAKPDVVVTVELIDGRRLAGRVGSFTAQLEESREIALIGPLAASPSATTPLTRMDGDFAVIREEHIATITGAYIDAKAVLAAAGREPGADLQ